MKKSLNFQKRLTDKLNERVNDLSRENKQLKKEISGYEKFLEKFNLKEKFKEFVEMLKQTQRLVKFKGRETERSR